MGNGKVLLIILRREKEIELCDVQYENLSVAMREMKHVKSFLIFSDTEISIPYHTIPYITYQLYSFQNSPIEIFIPSIVRQPWIFIIKDNNLTKRHP